ncbi:MAG: PRC-barrel domain-containing protein [Thermoplasmata archaeon]
MKKFISELKGKTVMTSEGVILGTIDNFVIDLDTGEIKHLLVTPTKSSESSKFETDAQGRMILPFKSMKSAKDVVVLELK